MKITDEAVKAATEQLNIIDMTLYDSYTNGQEAMVRRMLTAAAPYMSGGIRALKSHPAQAEAVIAAKDARVKELEAEIIKNGEDEDLEQWFYWRRKAKKAAQRCSNQKAQIAGMTKKVAKLEADNKRLREALVMIARIELSFPSEFREIARAALGEVKT